MNHWVFPYRLPQLRVHLRPTPLLEEARSWTCGSHGSQRTSSGQKSRGYKINLHANPHGTFSTVSLSFVESYAAAAAGFRLKDYPHPRWKVLSASSPFLTCWGQLALQRAPGPSGRPQGSHKKACFEVYFSLTQLSRQVSPLTLRNQLHAWPVFYGLPNYTAEFGFLLEAPNVQSVDIWWTVPSLSW